MSVGKTKPYPNVYLAFAHDKQSGEDWIIVSNEPATLQTFAQYRLRFQVEESFLDIKSNGFNLEASRLRDKFALCQLCGVIALAMLFLVLQGVQVVASGKRRQVDAHWKRGMSYLKLGWNWIRLAITQQWNIGNVVERLIMTFSNRHTKFITIDKQTNYNVVHLNRFRKTNCFAS